MIFISNGYSQDINTPINTGPKKGNFFLSWGYNWSWYSNSDIKFKGENYNFELKDRKNSKTYTISENNNTEKPTKEAIDNVFNLINR